MIVTLIIFSQSTMDLNTNLYTQKSTFCYVRNTIFTKHGKLFLKKGCKNGRRRYSASIV